MTRPGKGGVVSTTAWARREDVERAAHETYLQEFVASLRPLTPAEVARVTTLLQPSPKR